MTELLTPDEAAQVLRCSKRQVYRWFDSGELRYVTLSKRLVQARELEAFISARAKRRT